MKKLVTSLLLISGVVCAQPFDNSLTKEAIEKRIKPVGSVYLASDKAAQTQVAAGPRSGQKVYQASCFACHGTGAMGAPKTKADWEARAAKGKDTLLSNAINGINGMPPKGTCMDCSDEELQAAIEFMQKGQ